MGKEHKKGKTYTISQDDLEAMLAEASRRGGEAGLTAFRESYAESRKQRANDTFNATKVLIKKYRDFKAMAQKSIYDAETADDNASDEYLSDVISQLMQYGVDKRELDIVSNKKRVYKTIALMSHVDVMLEAYRIKCCHSLNSDEQRRYRVIKALYLDDAPISTYELCEIEHIGTTTLYATINKAISDLSILIFGIDGIRM